jgi:hypothetical protein
MGNFEKGSRPTASTTASNGKDRPVGVTAFAASGDLVVRVGVTSNEQQSQAYGFDPIPVWRAFLEYVITHPELPYQTYFVEALPDVVTLLEGRDFRTGEKLQGDVKQFQRLLYQALRFGSPRKANPIKRDRKIKRLMDEGFDRGAAPPSQSEQKNPGGFEYARTAQRRRRRGEQGWKS